MVEVVEACIDGRLDQIDLKFKEDAAVCVVLASDGYPVSYEKGLPIRGLENFKGKDGYYVFHAGTKFGPEGTGTHQRRQSPGSHRSGQRPEGSQEERLRGRGLGRFRQQILSGTDIGKAIDEA